MTPPDRPANPPIPLRPAAGKTPPKLFECKLCGKVFDARDGHPSCPECDSTDVEQVG
jgi:hypothetical protein